MERPVPDATPHPQTAISMRTCNGPSPAKGRPRVSPRNPAANQTESTAACPRTPRTPTRIKEDVDGPRPSTGWRVPSCVRGLDLGASTRCRAASSSSHVFRVPPGASFRRWFGGLKTDQDVPGQRVGLHALDAVYLAQPSSTHSTSPAVLQPGKWRRTRPGIKLKIRSRPAEETMIVLSQWPSLTKGCFLRNSQPSFSSTGGVLSSLAQKGVGRWFSLRL